MKTLRILARACALVEDAAMLLALAASKRRLRLLCAAAEIELAVNAGRRWTAESAQPRS